MIIFIFAFKDKNNMGKRKTFIVAMSMMFALSATSQTSKVEWRNGDDLDIKVGHPHAIPTVTSDDDDVTIKCDSTLYNVDVVIKDQYGNVMHHSIQVIGPDGTTIYIPEDTNGEREKTTIELYYDRKHLSGYFDE